MLLELSILLVSLFIYLLQAAHLSFNSLNSFKNFAVLKSLKTKIYP